MASRDSGWTKKDVQVGGAVAGGVGGGILGGVGGHFVSGLHPVGAVVGGLVGVATGAGVGHQGAGLAHDHGYGSPESIAIGGLAGTVVGGAAGTIIGAAVGKIVDTGWAIPFSDHGRQMTLTHEHDVRMIPAPVGGNGANRWIGRGSNGVEYMGSEYGGRLRDSYRHTRGQGGACSIRKIYSGSRF